MILSDREILQRCREANLLSPFEEKQVREYVVNRMILGHELNAYRMFLAHDLNPYPRKILSYGLSSAGYDLRLAPDDFRIFSPAMSAEIDPKAFDEASLIRAPLRDAKDGSQYFLLPPHTYALGVTVETFDMPRDLMAICIGKSSYARCGLVLNTTMIEPEWRGRLVLEFSNSADLPIRLYVDEGICQVVLCKLTSVPMVSYSDRDGKYQDQRGLVTPKI